MKKSELEWHNEFGMKGEKYEEFSEYDYNKFISHFIKETGVSQADKILELGCGTGAFTRRIMDIGHNIIGLDISNHLLQNANKIKKGNHVQGDMELLPFSDNSFDTILAVASLHHLPTLSECISESHRVLKKRGKFFILDPNRHNPLGWAETNLTFFRKKVRKIRGHHHCTPNERYYSIKEMRRALDDIGFKKTKVYTLNFIPFKNAMTIRKLEGLIEKIPAVNKFGGTIVACSTKP